MIFVLENTGVFVISQSISSFLSLILMYKNCLNLYNQQPVPHFSPPPNPYTKNLQQPTTNSAFFRSPGAWAFWRANTPALSPGRFVAPAARGGDEFLFRMFNNESLMFIIQNLNWISIQNLYSVNIQLLTYWQLLYKRIQICFNFSVQRPRQKFGNHGKR